MSDQQKPKRAYRKNVSSGGMIFLDNHEYEVAVKNVSLSGLLVELNAEDVPQQTMDLFQAIQHSPLIDIYLPKLRICGEG